MTSSKKSRIYVKMAAILMTIVGILRGIGGTVLILQGNNVEVNPPISASVITSKACGVGLLLISILLIYASYALLKYQSRKAWKLSWLAIGLFVISGLVNGYLLFGTPFVQDQIINFSTFLLVGTCLYFGKKSLNNKIK